MPASTPHGAPYPLPTEPVAEGAQAIRNLAEWADLLSARTIADVELAAPAAVIDFTNIPQTYSHLLLLVDATETGAVANDVLYLRIHGDTAAYSLQYITGSGVAVAAAEAPDTTGGLALGLIVGQGFGSGRGATMIVVPNYASGAGRKNAFGLTFSNAGDTSSGQTVRLTGGVYRASAAAIARLTLAPGTGDFAAGSHATLYGL